MAANPPTDIDLQEQISLNLSAKSASGRTVTLSNVKWTQVPVVGDINPTSDPNVFTFNPTAPGTCQISATADYTIN